jgi:CDP-paratose 2-epimerase
MKRILITGSTGLLGSEAVDYFTEKGWEVIGIDADMRHRFFDTPGKTPQYPLDIRDRDRVMDLFKQFQFDAVIHCAAQPSHEWSKDNPTRGLRYKRWRYPESA